MSHVTTIESEERYDIPTLMRMCADEGWEFMEGKLNHRSYHPNQACGHVVRVPGADYEIGVVMEDGEWRLKWDSYGPGGLQAKLGNNGGLLKQAYGMAKTRMVASSHRRRCYQRPAQQKGWTRLVIDA